MAWIDRWRGNSRDLEIRQRAVTSPPDWTSWTYPGASNGAATLISTWGAANTEQILPTFVAQSKQAYSSNTVVFSVILARLMLYTEAVFKFRNLDNKKLRGNTNLSVLEHPWPNGTTGELLARMEQDASLAGNCYIWNAGEQLVRLRPDWVTIVSEEDSDLLGRTYRKVIGYFWDPRVGGDFQTMPQFFTVDEVAHYSPIPDPLAQFRGMSWLTPISREVQADQGLTDYKITYLDNAATPNLMVRYQQEIGQGTIDRLQAQIQARHSGVMNGFKTIVLDQGADLSVVGSTPETMNFTTVQAAGENRIAAAGGVPGIVVGLKEGLMAATYSNYEQAMRRFADITMRPLWRMTCAALAPLIEVPPGTQLWYDISDVAALRAGEKERSDISYTKAQAAKELVDAGYTLDSIVTALESGDFNQLVADDKPEPPPNPGIGLPGQQLPNLNTANGQPQLNGANGKTPLPAGGRA
jgi:phage portal protein BeeE